MNAPILGGLPYDVSSVSYVVMLRYILILLLGNCAGGIPAARLAVRPQAFSLTRAGWRRWFAGILRRCFLLVLALCALLLAQALAAYPTWRTLWAWLLFTLHMQMIAALQVFLMAVLKNAAAALAPVLLVQLASLFLSMPLRYPLALVAPGNWGALNRTAEFEVPGRFGALHGGFPLWAAAALNLAVLLPICLFGWRLARRRYVKD